MQASLTGVIRERHRLRAPYRWAIGVWLLLVIGAWVAIVQTGHTSFAGVTTTAAFAAFAAPFAAFFFTSFNRDISIWIRRTQFAPLQVGAATTAIYLVWSSLTGQLSWSGPAILFCYTTIPLLILGTASRQAFCWQDAAAILALWLPFEFGLLNSIWTWPEGGAGNIMNILIAVNVAIIGFVGQRRLQYAGIRLAWHKTDTKLFWWSVGLFLLIALPFGLATGFIAWNPVTDPMRWVGSTLAIFFFIAIPEELLFRGVMQNLMARRLGTIKALGVTALIFGLAHLNNGDGPDWRYFVLATIAGIFYGALYVNRYNLLPAIALHTLIDVIWSMLFMASET